MDAPSGGVRALLRDWPLWLMIVVLGGAFLAVLLRRRV
jgi:hypothetical protein